MFDNPAKQIDVWLSKVQVKKQPVALQLAMQLRWAVRNKMVETGGAFSKTLSTKEIVAPVDQSVLQRILITLQDDLAARFKAAGWQATTRDELGGVERSVTRADPRSMVRPRPPFGGSLAYAMHMHDAPDDLE